MKASNAVKGKQKNLLFSNDNFASIGKSINIKTIKPRLDLKQSNNSEKKR